MKWRCPVASIARFGVCVASVYGMDVSKMRVSEFGVSRAGTHVLSNTEEERLRVSEFVLSACSEC